MRNKLLPILVTMFWSLQRGEQITIGQATRQNFDADTVSESQNPYTDIRRFNSRSVNANLAPQTASITATINADSTKASISSASTLQNNDGVVIYGAGPTCPLRTPAAPTVTSVTAAGGTGTGLYAVGPTGNTTYSYAVVPVSQDFCFPLPSATGSLTTGPASLGPHSVSIKSCSRVGTVATCRTASAHTITAGTEIYITRTSDNTNFGGHFTVDTVADNMHFTFTNGIDATNGVGVSSTGGSANWYQAAHIVTPRVAGAWEYCFYRVTAPAGFIGCGHPQSASGATDLAFDDFGSTMTSNYPRGAWLPSTLPIAGQAKALSTTIVSGAGTTTLRLANAAATSVTSQFIRFDSGPTLLTAANFARNNGSPLYIPLGGFVINYPITLPGLIGIVQEGALTLNAPITIQQPTVWMGTVFPLSGVGVASFAQNPGAPIVVNESSPGLYADNVGGIWLEGLGFSGGNSGNGASPVFFNLVSPFTIKKCTFVTGTTVSDTMGIGLYLRGQNGAGNAVFDNILDTTFLGGPIQVNGTSDTPQVFGTALGYLNMERINFSLRSVLLVPAQAGLDFTLNGGRQQGGIMPVVTMYNSAGLLGVRARFANFQEDTMAHALLANGLGGGITSNVVIENAGEPGADNGTIPGLVTGRPVNTLFSPFLWSLGQNVNLIQSSDFTNNALHTNGIGRFVYDMATPTTPNVELSAGGSVPIGTWLYRITAVDVDGSETRFSVASSCVTTSGNQTCTVTPPLLPTGAVGYRPYRGNPGGGIRLLNIPGGCGATNFIAPGVNFVDIFGFTCDTSASKPAAGTSILGPNGVESMKVRIGNGTPLSRYSRFSVSLSPTSVAANTCAAQSFTITGVAAADILISVVKPTEQAGLSLSPGHVTGANKVTINFCNNTGSAITPTAAELYQLITIQ